MTVDCPHCGQPMLLAPGRSAKKLAVVIGAMGVLLILIAGGALFYLKKMPGTTATAVPVETNSPAKKAGPVIVYVATRNDFKISRINLQKSENGGLVYAVGTLKNDTGHQRFGIKVMLDVRDAQTNKIGSASDYVATMEPHGERRFKALLVQPKAASVELADIEEQK